MGETKLDFGCSPFWLNTGCTCAARPSSLVQSRMRHVAGNLGDPSAPVLPLPASLPALLADGEALCRVVLVRGT